MTATGDAVTCRSVLQVFGMIGNKWSLLVVGRLRNRRLRFGELQREVPGISQRMLTVTLRQLERDGLVSRAVHATVPPKVEYELTALGATMIEPALTLGAWVIEHLDEIGEHRRRYDLAAREAGDTP